MNIFAQEKYNIRLEWGVKGVHILSETCDVIVIVDILSFTTCVSIAVEKGALVYPYYFKDDRAIQFAKGIGANLAGKRSSEAKFSLSPSSMSKADHNTKLVLPSPNGATLSMESKKPTIAACLRNAKSVAEYISRFENIGVIPSAERWHDDSSMRPSFEDLLGAGAVISNLKGKKSIEAQMAEIVFEKFADNLFQSISACSSGQELIQRRYEEDVMLASELNVSTIVPVLNVGGYYSDLANFQRKL